VSGFRIFSENGDRMTIALALDLFIFLVVVGVTIVIVRSYFKSAAETRYGRVWDAARDSATLLWSYAVIVGTGLVTILGGVADIVDPGTAAQIQAYLPPNFVAAFVIGIMVITIAARLRSMGPRQ
jgi:hypothetical protein